MTLKILSGQRRGNILHFSLYFSSGWAFNWLGSQVSLFEAESEAEIRNPKITLMIIH